MKNDKLRQKEKRQSVKSQPVQSVVERDLLDKTADFFQKHINGLFILCLLSLLVSSVLTFDTKISEGYDDAEYIQAGYNYAKDFFGSYYANKPPLYVMILALPIALFGVNLVVLKSMSLLFALVGVFVLYNTFKKRIAAHILMPALLLTVLNVSWLYYTSQTYTEMFVFMIIALFCYAAFRLDDVSNDYPLKKVWKQLLLLGFISFLYNLSRSLAYASILAVIVYFVYRKKYWLSLIVPVVFAVFQLMYDKVIKPLCWGQVSVRQVDSMFLSYLSKDPYNSALGNEDLWGMVVRFFTNLGTYSSQFFGALQIKGDTPPSSSTPYIYAILFVVLMIIGAVYAWKNKQQAILYLFLLVAFLLGSTYIVMHAFWGQERLVLLYLPLILLVMFYGIVSLLKKKRLWWMQWIYPFGLLVLLCLNVHVVKDKMVEKVPVLSKNLSGNRYYGFTPDWVNYFKMSEWAARNIPADKKIVCRKPPMSFVYTGREFEGIYSVPSLPIDTVLQASAYEHEFIGALAESMSQNVFETLRPYMKALLIGDRSAYFSFDVPESFYKSSVDYLNQYKVKFSVDRQTMLNELKQGNQTAFGVFPEDLLRSLKSRGISYVLDASLRANPAQKTENIISTVSRYCSFVEQKYPGTFRKVYQVGGDNDEPAMIYEIYYPENF